MEKYWKIAPMRNIFEEQFNKIVVTGTYNWHRGCRATGVPTCRVT